jgi:hypothetical protein
LEIGRKKEAIGIPEKSNKHIDSQDQWVSTKNWASNEQELSCHRQAQIPMEQRHKNRQPTLLAH